MDFENKKQEKAILFGASGKLGREIISLGKFFTPSHRDVEIENYDKLKDYIETINPNLIIHAAALVGAKECEYDKKKAYQTNVIGTYNLAKICHEKKIKLIYISTDSIFDGEKGNYKEEDIPNPINFYSLTKLIGEGYVKMLESFLIIRTSFFPKDNFPYKAAFVDQYTCRMCVEELAPEIILAIRKKINGVLHIAGPRDTLFNIVKKFNPKIKMIDRKETGLNLPKDLSLNIEKWKKIKEN